MTEQQIIFANNWLIDRNATAAAIRSGYSVATARQIGHNLLQKPEIKAYIKEKIKEIQDDTLLDVSWVLNRAKDISDRCMQVEPVLALVDGEWVETGEYKFDAVGAKAGAELVAKVIGAFEKDNAQQNKILIGKDLSEENYK